MSTGIKSFSRLFGLDYYGFQTSAKQMLIEKKRWDS